MSTFFFNDTSTTEIYTYAHTLSQHVVPPIFASVPLGCGSDHREVLWDMDTEAMEAADEAGLRAVRTPTPGVDPAYVSGLVDLIQERLRGTPAADRPHATSLGPWFDVCRQGCCENVRAGFKQIGRAHV